MTLYVVATPIGNLGDITYRAHEVLKTVDRVVAEDTRQTRKLLSHLGLSKKVETLHAHSSEHEVERLLAFLRAGESLAIVTDAGTPIVSDPGDVLVKAAIAEGINVVPLPGPSAVLAALVGSGLGGAGFRFVGFVPRDGVARQAALGSICATPEAVVLFESPERTKDTLTELAGLMPERSACVARELTKLHEEFARGSLSDLATREEWRGEVVIVLGSWEPPRTEITDDDLDARIDAELAAGTHSKAIAERLAAWSGRPKRDVYERVVRRKPR